MRPALEPRPNPAACSLIASAPAPLVSARPALAALWCGGRVEVWAHDAASERHLQSTATLTPLRAAVPPRSQANQDVVIVMASFEQELLTMDRWVMALAPTPGA